MCKASSCGVKDYMDENIQTWLTWVCTIGKSFLLWYYNVGVRVIMVKWELPNTMSCSCSKQQKELQPKGCCWLQATEYWISLQYSVHISIKFVSKNKNKTKNTLLETLNSIFFFFKVKLMKLSITSFPMKNKKYKGLLQQPKGNCALMNLEVCNKLREANNATHCNLLLTDIVGSVS